MRRRAQPVQKTRPSNINVRVIESPEPIDLAAWCARYVALLIAADRKSHELPEAA
jgi:hypothetical protein